MDNIYQQLRQANGSPEKLRAVGVLVDNLISEKDDAIEVLDARLGDALLIGTANDRRQIKEEKRNLQEQLQDLEAVSARLPSLIKAAEQREMMAAVELKHPEAKKLQQRELALHVDLFQLSSKLMAALDELAKVSPALAALNSEFSGAGRRDLCVPVAEAVLRGKTGIANNYRLDAIVNRDAVRDVTAAFGLETLAREFTK